jgi:hypothetical protein
MLDTHETTRLEWPQSVDFVLWLTFSDQVLGGKLTAIYYDGVWNIKFTIKVHLKPVSFAFPTVLKGNISFQLILIGSKSGIKALFKNANELLIFQKTLLMVKFCFVF